MSLREIQREIHDYYAADASKYDEERKLKICRIYDQIPSNLENKKKRVVAQRIEGKKGKTFADYEDEFEYLISAGIALNVQAISTPESTEALSERCRYSDLHPVRQQYPRNSGRRAEHQPWFGI